MVFNCILNPILHIDFNPSEFDVLIKNRLESHLHGFTKIRLEDTRTFQGVKNVDRVDKHHFSSQQLNNKHELTL